MTSPYSETEENARHQTTRSVADDVMFTVHSAHSQRALRRGDHLAAWNCSQVVCQSTAARLMEMLRRCQK